MTKEAPGAYYKIGRQRFNTDLVHGILQIVPKKSTIIDIGARGGKYVDALRENGYSANGIDGIPNIEEQTKGLVSWCDLSKKLPTSYKDSIGIYGWGLFIGVGEHIPSEYECQVLDNVSMLAKTGLIVSWGDTKQGKGHVNPHIPIYIASEFARRGWFVDSKETIFLKSCFSSARSPRHTIMVLKND
jgi:hypothetical protein